MSFHHTRAVAGAQGLTRKAHHLLLILADKADRRGRSFYRQATLAEIAGCSERTIRAALKELEASGWISREPKFRFDGTRSSDVITVHDLTRAARYVHDRAQLELRLLKPVENMGTKPDINRQPLPVVQPATFAALNQTASKERS